MPIQHTGSSAHELFLRSESPAVRNTSESLWNDKSGAPGLLDAQPAPGTTKAGYIWDPATRQYHRADNGMTVTDKQLESYVSNVTSAATLEMRKTTQQLIAGAILLSVWYSRMQSLMAALYRTIWVLAIGGWAFDDDTQRNLFYLFVLLQFNHLDNFYYQLEHESQPLDGSAMARAGLYGRHGNGMYQNILLEQGKALGHNEAIRILGPNENHCNDSSDRPGCLELAAEGWMDIDRMTPIGDATCYSNCQCRIRTR